ncbi:MAG: FxsA family protein, partial [Gammaproteobacteria bacterium]|nr:FxsA family protein [Gammaproteobacteria bacterium]MBT5746684.1 FxsA family protein [Gammaproteobacteria bacterium]
MNPFKLLFAIFIFIPIIEVYLLIQVGSWIGVVPTVLLVITTAMMGVSMLKSQGLSTLMDAQRSLASGQVPAFQLLEGA